MEISHGVCIYGSSKNSQLLMISSFVRRGRLLIISASIRGEITCAAYLAMNSIAQMVTEERTNWGATKDLAYADDSRRPALKYNKSITIYAKYNKSYIKQKKERPDMDLILPIK